MTTLKLTDQELLEKDIIELMGLDKLPEQEKKDLLTKLIDNANRRIVMAVMTHLTPEHKENINELVANNKTDQDIYNYIESVVPNLPEIATEEIVKFKKEVVSLSENTRAKTEGK